MPEYFRGKDSSGNDVEIRAYDMSSPVDAMYRQIDDAKDQGKQLEQQLANDPGIRALQAFLLRLIFIGIIALIVALPVCLPLLTRVYIHPQVVRFHLRRVRFVLLGSVILLGLMYVTSAEAGAIGLSGFFVGFALITWIMGRIHLGISARHPEKARSAGYGWVNLFTSEPSHQWTYLQDMVLIGLFALFVGVGLSSFSGKTELLLVVGYGLFLFGYTWYYQIKFDGLAELDPALRWQTARAFGLTIVVIAVAMLLGMGLNSLFSDEDDNSGSSNNAFNPFASSTPRSDIIPVVVITATPLPASAAPSATARTVNNVSGQAAALDPSATPTEIAAQMGMITGTNMVNVRSGPGTDYQIIRALAPGSTVTIIGSNADESWRQIRQENGKEGWVMASLIQLSEAAPAPADTPTEDATATPQSTSDDVKLTLFDVINKPFQFARDNGTVIAAQLYLLPDGTISGYSHPNESRWDFEDDGHTLVFYASDGAASTRFTDITEVNGRLVLKGKFLLDETVNVTHILEEQ